MLATKLGAEITNRLTDRRAGCEKIAALPSNFSPELEPESITKATPAMVKIMPAAIFRVTGSPKSGHASKANRRRQGHKQERSTRSNSLESKKKE